MALILFVAGDPSGDAHAARLIEALKVRDPSLAFSGLGGPAMQRAGCALLQDLTTTAAIGPFDALRHVPKLLRAKRSLEDAIRRQRPDLAILVDFGDYNLPVIAPLVKRHGIPTLYYISPQLWAWGRFRLRYVRRCIERTIVFFKFEEEFYHREGIPATWVGHPLVDAARPSISREEAVARFHLNPWRRTVGLLPGSRAQEIARHLPLLLAAAERIAWQMPGVQFLLPRATWLPREQIDRHLARARAPVYVAEGSIYDALQVMEAAVVASGTATLESALCEVPMVVVYRTSWPTYVAARAVVRIPRIALVNVIAGREIVPECIQRRAAPERIARTMVELLRDDERLTAMRTSLRGIRAQLGEPGAVGRVADVVLERLRRSGTRSVPK